MKTRYYRLVYTPKADSPESARELLQAEADKHGAIELGHIVQKASCAAYSVAELVDYQPLDSKSQSC